MSPLPGYRIIPSDWAQHHRPVAAGTMTAPCEIRRVSDGPAPYPLPDGWDGSALIWAGRCRLQELKREGNPVPTEQPTSLREYLVTLPFENDEGVPLPELRAGERGDVVHVAGRRMTISSIMFGSEEFERDVICTDNLTQQNPD